MQAIDDIEEFKAKVRNSLSFAIFSKGLKECWYYCSVGELSRIRGRRFQGEMVQGLQLIIP
jgi:hypothetical protein